MSYENTFRTKTKKLNEILAKEADKKVKKLFQEMEENPRTYSQCVARGCDGCSICKTERN